MGVSIADLLNLAAGVASCQPMHVSDCTLGMCSVGSAARSTLQQAQHMLRFLFEATPDDTASLDLRLTVSSEVPQAEAQDLLCQLACQRLQERGLPPLLLSLDCVFTVACSGDMMAGLEAAAGCAGQK